MLVLVMKCLATYILRVIALQELAQRGAGHVERYRRHVLDAMNPSALLQELGLGQSKSFESKCDADVDPLDGAERGSHGDTAGVHSFSQSSFC